MTQFIDVLLSPSPKPDLVDKLSARCFQEYALIFNAQHGDLDAFNQLVLTYQDSIFNIALRILGDTEQAADATQEAFISAFRGINGFRGGSFIGWLMRIVTNACYDEIRRQKRHPTTPLETIFDDSSKESSPWLADASPSPEENLQAREFKHAIQQCLDALSLDFRAVVVLVDVSGLSYGEAASVMRVPLGTVKSRLARARLCLRGSLQGFPELLPSDFRLNCEVI